jgi:hypothetical protein
MSLSINIAIAHADSATHFARVMPGSDSLGFRASVLSAAVVLHPLESQPWLTVAWMSQ